MNKLIVIVLLGLFSAPVLAGEHKSCAFFDRHNRIACVAMSSFMNHGESGENGIRQLHGTFNPSRVEVGNLLARGEQKIQIMLSYYMLREWGVEVTDGLVTECEARKTCGAGREVYEIQKAEFLQQQAKQAKICAEDGRYHQLKCIILKNQGDMVYINTLPLSRKSARALQQQAVAGDVDLWLKMAGEMDYQDAKGAAVYALALMNKQTVDDLFDSCEAARICYDRTRQLVYLAQRLITQGGREFRVGK